MLPRPDVHTAARSTAPLDACLQGDLAALDRPGKLYVHDRRAPLLSWTERRPRRRASSCVGVFAPTHFSACTGRAACMHQEVQRDNPRRGVNVRTFKQTTSFLVQCTAFTLIHVCM